MPQGHNEKYFKFLILDIITDKKYYFKESPDIRKELGIKKGTLYNMLNNDENTCPKYKNQYKAYKINKPIYERVIIDYNEEFYNDDE